MRPSSSGKLGAKKLGQLLVERGWVSGEQILRAIRSQRALGGRLGTCLLELEVIPEEKLLEILAEQQGAPVAPVETLKSIPEDVIHLVPPEVAGRCQAVPFSATERELDVVILNPRDVSLLDELAFCTSRKIRPHVVSEVRMAEALTKYYGFGCPHRFLMLLERLEESKSADNVGLEGLAPLAGGDPRNRIEWKAPEEVFDSLDATLSIQGEWRRSGQAGDEAGNATTAAAVVAEAAVPIELGDVDRLLEEVRSSNDVAAAMTRYLAPRVRRLALFQVRPDALVPWHCEGEDFDRSRFRALRISLREPSVFLNLKSGADLYYGALPPMPSHRQLVGCWGGDWPAECLLLPIRLAERLVAVVYADQGRRRMEGLDLESWRTLASMAAAALELCILRKKLRAN